MALATTHNDSETSNFFFKVTSFFKFKVRNELEVSGRNVAKRKEYSKHSGVIRMAKFIHQVWDIINHEPSKLIRAIAK